MKRSATLIPLIFGLFWTAPLMATEEPNFESLRKEDNLEIRRYAPVIIAETLVDGDMDSASNQGFRRIADYIFGNNQKASIAMTVPVVIEAEAASEKIAMTTPVSIEPQNADGSKMAGAQRWRIHFVMPSQYTLATLPKPLNPQVQLREIPGKTFAALTYSGINTESTVQEKTEQLHNWLKAQKLELIGKPQLARYNPPWTLPFLRRNEILQEIKAD
ncbi:MAG: heme-binding protein [Rhodocyclaceae bacterium]|nr:heme-binding protein [Rhodocyclaceae bacterium]